MSADVAADATEAEFDDDTSPRRFGFDIPVVNDVPFVEDVFAVLHEGTLHVSRWATVTVGGNGVDDRLKISMMYAQRAEAVARWIAVDVVGLQFATGDAEPAELGTLVWMNGGDWPSDTWTGVPQLAPEPIRLSRILVDIAHGAGIGLESLVGKAGG